ncbi:unnamed protein product, partial [Symbiodinium sp. CCMP2456]
IVANSGRATGVAINDRDQFSIDAALILSTLAHAAFGLDGEENIPPDTLLGMVWFPEELL